jgi:hypothetical protein
MRLRILTPGLVVLIALTAAHAVRREYAPGKIVEVQERSRDRVLLYQVNTPIMTEDPYVTVSVDVHGTVYEGEFLPHNQELFPDFWKADETVSVRTDKHFMYLKREDGTEAKFLILSKSQGHFGGESH